MENSELNDLARTNSRIMLGSMIAEFFVLLVLVAALVFGIKSCSQTGVFIIGDEQLDALHDAQNAYEGYDFELAPASVGTFGGKYVVLCKIDGKWVKVGTGNLDELGE